MTKVYVPSEWQPPTPAHPGAIPDCAGCGSDEFVFLALRRVIVYVCRSCGEIARKNWRQE